MKVLLVYCVIKFIIGNRRFLGLSFINILVCGFGIELVISLGFSFYKFIFICIGVVFVLVCVYSIMWIFYGYLLIVV